jgi:3-oxosteroid 1-dehydrogenase
MPDLETDVVVVGSGAAGLTGALIAAMRGAEVVVLEKASLLGGTTAVSGGGVWIPANRHMADEGVDDSHDEALAYMRACADGQGEDEHVVALAEHGPELVRVLEDEAGLRFRSWPAVGGTIDYRPWLDGWKPGARTLDSGKVPTAGLGEWAGRLRLGSQSVWTSDKLDYYRHKGHLAHPGSSPAPAPRGDGAPEYVAAGTALVAQLLQACLDRGVTVCADSPVEELLVEGGRVVGVRADEVVRARRGVLLATGGFAANEELKRLWLTRPLDETCDVESNQGDGHLMGIAVGAGVAGLGDAWWMPHMAGGRRPDGSLVFIGSREDRHLPHTLIVNRRGRRFMNEALNYYDAGEPFGAKAGGPVRNHPAWYVFDQHARARYAIVAAKFPGGEVPDWMVSADTIPELAERLGIEPAILTDTIDRFNAFARAGRDDDFGRGENEWDVAWGDPEQRPNASLGPLDRGPFYALEVRNGALATRGGLRITARGQVRSALPPADPIPGLYAAGNVSNGAVAGAYVGPGATIGAAMTFGYLAALDMTGGTQ